MIYYMKPFSVDKSRFGETVNAHCALVPNPDDWICIMDYDTMILCPETYIAIEAAIARYPETAVFGAYTNRIGYPFQRLTNEPSVETNIIVHHGIAKARAAHGATGECDMAHTLAGFFLLFRKEYWLRSPFQAEIIDSQGRFFDFAFCMLAQREKLPMRIIKGAYLFHWYRFDKVSHKDKSHLKLHT